MRMNNFLARHGREDDAQHPVPVRYETDIRRGLNDEQVAERVEAGQVNLPVAPPTKTVRQIIFSNVFTYFNLIFVVLAVALIAVGSFNDLLFLPVVVCNILIGTIQEINAKHTLDKLNLVNEPHARVIRNGAEQKVPVSELVLDDIVLFGAGNQISADATLLEGEVTVNESMITGEPDEIRKTVGDTLSSGSYVVSGACTARLDRVGADSFVSRLTLEAKRSRKKQEVGMMRSLTRLIAVIGILLIPIGTALYLRQTLGLGLSVKDGVVNTAAALIGMIPEGLYLLVSVALAVSVMRLARKHTLVHEMKCIETLARVDVLCVDKTGTITDDEMVVTDVVPLKVAEEDVVETLTEVVSNSGADNATMAALKKRFSQSGCRRAERVQSFSSTYKYSGCSFGEEENYVIGAPEFVLREQYGAYQAQIERYAAEGKRVLVLCALQEALSGEALHAPVLPMGLVCLTNRIRPEAKDTFAYFAEQGVTVRVISGDNPVTVANVAAQAGIEGAERYVDASTLDTKEKIAAAAEQYTVFGRVTPEQKKQLVIAMKRAGHTVAMTGDGVNDVLALKEADCSIAMASGSEVAGQVSQLVLLDSNFAHMPSVVAEGRRVINNIERAAALFLVKNIFSFIMAWISIFAAFAYPLQAAQLSFISALTIGVPSFFLALEPNKSRVRGRFLTNVLYRALPVGLTNAAVVLLAVAFGMAFSLDADSVSTICALLMAVTGFMMLFRVCRPFNRMRAALWTLLCAAFVGGYLLVGPLFSMGRLDAPCALVFFTLALLVYPFMSALTRGFDLLLSGVRKIAHRIVDQEKHSALPAEAEGGRAKRK